MKHFAGESCPGAGMNLLTRPGSGEVIPFVRIHGRTAILPPIAGGGFAAPPRRPRVRSWS